MLPRRFEVFTARFALTRSQRITPQLKYICMMAMTWCGVAQSVSIRDSWMCILYWQSHIRKCKICPHVSKVVKMPNSTELFQTITCFCHKDPVFDESYVTLGYTVLSQYCPSEHYKVDGVHTSGEVDCFNAPVQHSMPAAIYQIWWKFVKIL